MANAKDIIDGSVEDMLKEAGYETIEDWDLQPESRRDGFECLAFHRGRWRHVKWSSDHLKWHLGYGQPFICDGDRAFASLPSNTPDRHAGNNFYDWRE